MLCHNTVLQGVVLAWLETAGFAPTCWNKYKKLGMRKVDLHYSDYLKSNLSCLRLWRREILEPVV